MKKYEPKALVAVSRYRKYFPSLPEKIRRDVYKRMRVLVLQQHGKTEEEAFRIVSTEMWKQLTPDTYRKLARHSWFLLVMKKILPFGFRHGSGAGWRYEWHLYTDPQDRFHFECRECLYRHIFEERGLMKLGAMFCHSDVINFGNLPYTDFKRTKTLCQGGDCCDFDFVRHQTDAGDGWNRTKSI